MAVQVIQSSDDEVVVHLFQGISASYRCPQGKKPTWRNVRRATLQSDHSNRMGEPLEKIVGHQLLHEGKRRAVGVFTNRWGATQKRAKKNAWKANQLSLPLGVE